MMRDQSRALHEHSETVEPSEEARQSGTVYNLLLNKGYGFIRGTKSQSIFFHVSGMRIKEQFNTLREGQPVDFFLTTGGPRNEPRAEDVVLL